MAKKTYLASDYKQFYSSTDPRYWPEESYVDDVSYIVDGVRFGDDHDFDPMEFLDTAKIAIESGSILSYKDSTARDLRREFERWLKEQNSVSLVVSVPKGKEDELKAFVKSLGGKA